MLGLTKNLIRRVKNIITVAQRSLSGSAGADGQHQAHEATKPPVKKRFGPEASIKDDAEATEVLNRHTGFLTWYIDFLKGELIPTASYQRHITALKAALLTARLGKHAGAGDELDIDIAKLISSDQTWIRLLFDLMLDPFDDVRDSASILLGLLPQELVGTTAGTTLDSEGLLGTLREFCARAQALADTTGRADHGDGAARSHGLLCRWLDNQDLRINLVSNVIQSLEDKITKAEKDLGHAALENPVHGDFAAIKYVTLNPVKSTLRLEGENWPQALTRLNSSFPRISCVTVKMRCPRESIH